MALQLIRRSEWGARKPESVSHNLTPRGVACHYEGPKMGTFPHTSCASKVRGIQAFHMDSRNWSDIAYNFLVCPHGYVYEGRGLGVRSAAQGTNNGNQYYYAVCGLWGTGDPFTVEAQQAFHDVIDYLRHNGCGNDIRPHQYFHSTQCPGDPVVRWIAAGAPASMEVKAMYDPPLVLQPIIAHLKHRDGGVALLGKDGSVYCYDCPYKGGTNGKSYMAPDHSPRRLVPNPLWDQQGDAVPWYLIKDQHGHEYGHTGF